MDCVSNIPDVVISIVTHNNAEIIENTIRCLNIHTVGIKYQIVIHDNDSKDDTIAKIKSIRSEHIHIIDSKNNYGFGFGHNRVVDNFHAKYYLICNPDIRINTNIIQLLFNYMEKNTDVGLTTPLVKYSNGEIQYLCKENPTVLDLFARRFLPQFAVQLFKARIDKYEMKAYGYNQEFDIPYASGCFMFFRSECFKNIGGFDEKFFMYLEDADVTRRLNKISRTVFFPYGSVEHLWSRGSHKSWRLTWITIQSAIYYFRKWGWKFY